MYIHINIKRIRYTSIQYTIHDISTPYSVRWLHVVGSIKLQVSFAEYRLFYRAFLQKRPVILSSLLIVATPYIYTCILAYIL